MSALKSRSNSLAGLTLDAVLGGDIIIQPPSPPSPPPLPPLQNSIVPHCKTSQTLFDIIRDEYANEGHKDRTTWQIFREKLRLKRTGSAWTSSLHIPASDILIPNPKHLGAAFRSQSGGLSNGNLNLRDLVSVIPMSDPPGSSGRSMFTRGSSMRIGSSKNTDDSADVSIPGDGPPSRSFKPQLSRHDSVRDHGDGEEDNRRRHHPAVTFIEERRLSAREAVAAQEAAEAEAAAAGGSDDEDEDDEDNEENNSGEAEENKSSGASAPKQTMSLMDLLEETDRQMGLTGSRYAMDEDEEYEEDEEEDEDYEIEGGGEGELTCCVCMVKIKGATFTPCGHTFCKLCSKELMAQKGHCPVCSSFVLEFLEIF